MGYRSDMKLIVSKKGFSELQSYIQREAEKYLTSHGYTKDQDELDDLNLLNCADSCEENSQGYLNVYWTWIKLYEDFPEVWIFYNALGYLEDNGYSYRCAIIGEEFDDNKLRYHDGPMDAEIRLPNLWIKRSFCSED